MINITGRRALLAAALTGLAGLAAAQPGPRGGMMGGGMMGGGVMGGGMMGGWDTTAYLKSLKDELAITPAQEPAWKEYADLVAGISEQMQAAHESVFESMGTATWQERREMMNTMFEARQNAFQTVHTAAEALLPKLDATQRAKARRSLPGLAYGPGMGRRR